jgi:hypothetical protein
VIWVRVIVCYGLELLCDMGEGYCVLWVIVYCVLGVRVIVCYG